MRDPISEILTKALAGYDDTYKMESNGQKYIQWAAVERDLIAVLAAEVKRREAAEAVVDLIDLESDSGMSVDEEIKLQDAAEEYRANYPKEPAT